MYIKNRRSSNKIKAFGLYQTLDLTESEVLRNRLLFIYSPLYASRKKRHSSNMIADLKKKKKKMPSNKSKSVAAHPCNRPFAATHMLFCRRTAFIDYLATL